MTENIGTYLKSELDKRKKANPLFGLRAFSKVLDVSPAQLSQVISGKRPVTIKMAKKVAKKLKLSPLEKQELLESLNPDSVSRKKELLSDERKLRLKEDEFKVICDWQHFAILSLAEIKENSSQASWIANRLNISLATASESRDRLIRMGLLEVRDKRLVVTSAPLVTTNDIKSDSIQRSHKQNLTLAQEKLEVVDISKREYTTVTMAVNPKQIEKAKKLITEFKRKLTETLEQGKKSEVYTLAIQLFPITIQRNKK